MSFCSNRYHVAAGASLLTAALAASPARADQFTFFDFTYEATTANTHDAHYDVRSPAHMLTQPNSWRAPIDYTAGTIYIEQEVLTKPSMEPTQVDVCFLTGGYGCLNTKLYTTTGRNTTVAPTKGFWQFGNINWGAKIPLVQLIVKDKNNANGGRPVSAFMPTKMRIALTAVSAGATYTPPPGFSAAPVADAGASDAGGDSGGVGTGGAGDASNTGGASGSTGGASAGSSGGSSGAASGGDSGAGSGGASASGSGGSSSSGSGGSGGTPAATGGTSGSAPARGPDPIGNPACSYGGRGGGGPWPAFVVLGLAALGIGRRRRSR